jgi:photosystem II stability/assembly factor-like uncharacterized protein
MKKHLILLVVLLPFLINAQNGQVVKPNDNSTPLWVQLMYAEIPDPGKVVETYEAFYKTHDFVKNQNTQYYKRWLREIGRKYRPDKTDESYGRFLQNEKQYLNQSKLLELSESKNANWVCIGPFDFDIEAASRSYAPGAAHVYTVKQSPSNPNVIYAGTATTGMWKSVDKGKNWALLTKDMPLTRVFAIEIDRWNENRVWFESNGTVYRSDDGGTNWTITGDSTFQSIAHSVKDIVMHPDSNQIVYLCSNQGFYRSNDTGKTWQLVLSGSFQEVEIHPVEHNVVYTVQQGVVSTRFLKSTDFGKTFQAKQNGWPIPAGGDEQKRTEISVTPAAPNIVYALATGKANGGSGLYGVYVSHNAGESWTFACCGPQPGGQPSATNINMMGWSDKGLDDGGQYYYDLAMDVSPIDSNRINLAGVNQWISNDGGKSFTCPAKWSHPYKKEYVHADIHDIRFYGDEVWYACDGGVFYSANRGDSVSRMMKGISGADFWGFGAGMTDGEIMLGGTYHNGTLLKDNDVYENGWLCTQGGDNVRGFVNPGNERLVYHDGGGKILSGDRNQPIGSFAFTKRPNASYIIGESSTLVFHPANYNKVYSGADSALWVSEDNGSSFEKIHTFPGKVTSFDLCQADPDVMVVAVYPGWWDKKLLYRTTDGGKTWKEITPPLSVINSNEWVPYSVALSATDTATIWIARTSQYGGYPSIESHRVFKSTDGGKTWVNLTTPILEFESPTNIIHQKGTNGGVYIGTRRAVYYRNDNMNDWALFNTGLPASTYSTKLQINYRKGKIYNGTNRSVYVSDLYEPSKPIAQISTNIENSYCNRDTIHFVDLSILTDTNATRQWTFQGGIPATSGSKNPKVVYQAPGVYDVTLIVSNAFGADTQTIKQFIHITDECSPDTVPGNVFTLNGTSTFASAPPLKLNSNTVTLSAWVKPSGSQKNFAGIVFSRGGNTTAGISVTSARELRYHWNDQGWNFASGLKLLNDEWNHVALVIYPDSAILYLNGIPSKQAKTQLPEEFDASLYIGRDPSGNRYFKGLIDEVAIWNRSLSRAEIREQMHLTKKPDNDTTLIAYYQFNRPDGLITDRSGIYHASPSNPNARQKSTVPAGGGVSYRMNINQGGIYDFTGTGLKMEFPAGGTYPDGEIVVSRINLNPDEKPVTQPVSRSYWIVNNYGQNVFFDPIEKLSFENYGEISPGQAFQPEGFRLYRRNFNADGNTWGIAIDSATIVTAGMDGNVFFENGTPVNRFGQFVISNETGVVTGIKSTQDDDDVQVYPNPVPAGEYIRIETRFTENITLTIHDAMGQLIYSGIENSKALISTWQLNKGIYMFSILAKEKNYVFRIVVM